MEYKYDISVVVPLFNEAESLPELYAWIKRVMNAHGFTFEIIFVNDGSTDTSWDVIEKNCCRRSSCTWNKVPSQLWQKSRIVLWLQSCERQSRDYDGRRLAGFS